MNNEPKRKVLQGDFADLTRPAMPAGSSTGLMTYVAILLGVIALIAATVVFLTLSARDNDQIEAASTQSASIQQEQFSLQSTAKAIASMLKLLSINIKNTDEAVQKQLSNIQESAHLQSTSLAELTNLFVQPPTIAPTNDLSAGVQSTTEATPETTTTPPSETPVMPEATTPSISATDAELQPLTQEGIESAEATETPTAGASYEGEQITTEASFDEQGATPDEVSTVTTAEEFVKDVTVESRAYVRPSPHALSSPFSVVEQNATVQVIGRSDGYELEYLEWLVIKLMQQDGKTVTGYLYMRNTNISQDDYQALPDLTSQRPIRPIALPRQTPLPPPALTPSSEG